MERMELVKLQMACLSLGPATPGPCACSPLSKVQPLAPPASHLGGLAEAEVGAGGQPGGAAGADLAQGGEPKPRAISELATSGEPGARAVSDLAKVPCIDSCGGWGRR